MRSLLHNIQVLFKLNRLKQAARAAAGAHHSCKHTLRLMMAVTSEVLPGMSKADARKTQRTTLNGLAGNKSILGVSVSQALDVLAALQQSCGDRGGMQT